MTNIKKFSDSKAAEILFGSTGSAWFWLLVRLYVGYQWLSAGWEKLFDQAWTGPSAGSALSGFLSGALAKAAGAHPDVQSWYAWFIRTVVLVHPAAWSYLVAWGEFLVGVALIVGIFTGVAAFFGLFMNLNYLLAGTVSTNPILFTLSIGLILAWKVAGYVGLDRFVLPRLGTPWQPGALFTSSAPQG
ncbi:DoxX family membrane protein [Patescibacteria group bacterium]|nr:DoxX family membrane protein [Patescibacteria group bacterium]